jgi:hypothetical protein
MQKEIPLRFLQRTYRPAIALENGARRRSPARIPLASSDTNEEVCGEARRVGYRGSSDQEHKNDLAVYRLKVRMDANAAKDRPMMITLPGFFVLIGGAFLPDSLS